MTKEQIQAAIDNLRKLPQDDLLVLDTLVTVGSVTSEIKIPTNVYSVICQLKAQMKVVLSKESLQG